MAKIIKITKIAKIAEIVEIAENNLNCIFAQWRELHFRATPK